MHVKPIEEGALLWEPAEDMKRRANMTAYMRWLGKHGGPAVSEYADLWRWSVTNLEDFWASLWRYFDIQAAKPYRAVLEDHTMPGARWFPGSELSYAQHVFRNASDDRPALIHQSEIRPLAVMSWAELGRAVASVTTGLREMGVGRGDRVVAYAPNIPETIIAFLATASLGAIWSSCSPDFGSRSVVDRFRQIQPKVLFAADGYRYGGKDADRRSTVAELRQSLPTLERTVTIPYLHPDAPSGALRDTVAWQDLLARKGDLGFEQVPFDHPLWVLYSSGTTGLPKAIVHGHGGILLEHLKFLGLHCDLKPEDRFFWFTTTGWVMWNVVVGGLLTGSTIVLYDGNPGYPTMDVLWEYVEKTGITVMGVSAAFLTACMKAGLEPGTTHDLRRLKTIGSTGSPLPPEGYRWAYERVKKDLWLVSTSGGTDIATGFVGGSSLLPVRAGELQCQCLGVKVESFDPAGKALTGEVGELVVTEPMPSMPLYLWNDSGNQRYLESYFDTYPGVWRHGDWIKFTPWGSSVIYGRSDSTLNRLGVRMGSSEIYSAVEDVPEVLDSLIVGFEDREGGYYMPLFVVLGERLTLDDAIKAKIREKIRTSLSPRHVPDDIFQIAAVPKTLNGKKLEVPIRKILMGVPADKALNLDSMANRESVAYFVEFAGGLRRPGGTGERNKEKGT